MKSRVQTRRLAGWTYTQSGKPVAYVMEENNPAEAILIEQPNWWSALRFALNFARNNACVYAGGPGDD